MRKRVVRGLVRVAVVAAGAKGASADAKAALEKLFERTRAATEK